MLALSYLKCGHVRAGMKDSVYINRGDLVKSNARPEDKGQKLLKFRWKIVAPIKAGTIFSLSI